MSLDPEWRECDLLSRLRLLDRSLWELDIYLYIKILGYQDKLLTVTIPHFACGPGYENDVFGNVCQVRDLRHIDFFPVRGICLHDRDLATTCDVLPGVFPQFSGINTKIHLFSYLLRISKIKYNNNLTFAR